MDEARDVARVFRGRSSNYAQSTWHERYAQGFVAALPLERGQTIVDAGAGTGFASRAVSERVGVTGHVIAIELVSDMADQIQHPDSPDASPITVVIGDATRTGLASGSVDAVICSAALLYMRVDDALAEWYRIVRPGGFVGFSGMGVGQPTAGRIFRELLAQHDLAQDDPASRLGSEHLCENALTSAGFYGATVIQDRVHFSDDDLRHAWDVHARGAKEQLSRISPDDQESLRSAFERKLAADPSRSEATVLYAFARRPVPDVLPR